MKIIGVLCILLFATFSSASPLSKDASQKQYISEEGDSLNPNYLYNQNENGNYNYGDLTADSDEYITVKPEHVKFYLYSGEGKGYEIYQMGDAVNLTYSKLFDLDKDNFFIIHGWTNNYESAVNVEVKKALLAMYDLNVFIVDWRLIASQLYPISRRAVPEIGELVGQFINDVMSIYNLPPKKFKLVGHSLGAHVAGCAGAEVNGLVDYIIGLDPAGPGFTVGNTEDRIDTTDAEFVQIIHTSNLLGFSSSIGHADIYPHNGKNQPGCLLEGLESCSHSRAYLYYAESVLSGGFTAKKCDSWSEYKNGLCDQNGSTYIGTLHIDENAIGDYYLDVNKDSPYAQS